jgi:hypothetical protein
MVELTSMPRSCTVSAVVRGKVTSPVTPLRTKPGQELLTPSRSRDKSKLSAAGPPLHLA